MVPPKSSILIGFSTINHPFCGTPIFGNTYTYVLNSQDDLVTGAQLGQGEEVKTFKTPWVFAAGFVVFKA